ncbi:MAG: hypothetical protein EXR00_08115 [Alphaproteobacteria bacterium]|nr:hypothetical protein [Alphaproteobacteria bacterium]
MNKTRLLTIGEVRARAEELTSKLHSVGLPKWYSVSEGQYVEVNRAYHLVTAERGTETRRQTTVDIDELLYWIFALLDIQRRDFFNRDAIRNEP